MVLRIWGSELAAHSGHPYESHEHLVFVPPKEPTETAVCSAHNVNAQRSLLAIDLDLALYVGIYVKAL